MAIKAAACPVPLALAENNPGAAGASDTTTGSLVWPFTVTVSDACVRPASSHGTWKLICHGEAAKTGALSPFRNASGSVPF